MPKFKIYKKYKMRKHSKIESREQKSLLFRNQIRQKQIEDYKRKIRLQFHQQSIICNPNYLNHKDHPTSQSQCQQNHNKNRQKIIFTDDAFQQSDQLDIGVEKYWRELEHIRNNLNHIWDQINAHIHIPSHKISAEINQQIIKQYDKLINLLLLQQQHQKQKNLSFTNIDWSNPYHDPILKPIISILHTFQQYSGKTMKYCEIEQRCIISYSFCKYLKKIGHSAIHLPPLTNTTSHNAILGYHNLIDWLDQTVIYVVQLLKWNKIQNKRPIQLQQLDFTALEEQILQRSAEAINEILLRFQISLEEQFQPQAQIFNIQTRINNVLNKLTQAYNLYLILYNHDYHYQRLKTSHENEHEQKQDIYIGNVCIGAVKSVIRMSVQMIYGFIRTSSFRWRNKKQDIKISINRTIELIKTLYEMISRNNSNTASNNEEQLDILNQYKIIEDATSDGIYGTILGIIYRLIDAIIHIIQNLQQQKQSQLHLDAKNITKIWFMSINNAELVKVLTHIIKNKLYKEDYVHQLYKQSNMCMYLLTCIFSLQHADTPNRYTYSRKYQQYRCQKSHLSNSTSMQIEYLKCIQEFMKKYNIKIDQQNNLSIRYIYIVGNGQPNSYYYHHLLQNL